VSQKQLLPLCTWLHTFILQPTSRLAQLHQAMLQLGTQPCKDNLLTMERPCPCPGSKDSSTSQGNTASPISPPRVQPAITCFPCDRRVAFSSVHTHLELSSVGTVRPLKYEREGRLLLQVCAANLYPTDLHMSWTSYSAL
jgi:hypothetical protein